MDPSIADRSISGSNDLNNQHGSWPLANQEMHAALEYAGYDNHFDYGVSEQAGNLSTDDCCR